MLTSPLSSSTNVVKTTMTVRLHPGNVEEQLQEELQLEQPQEEEPGELTPGLGLTNTICSLSSPNTGTERTDPDL